MRNRRATAGEAAGKPPGDQAWTIGGGHAREQRRRTLGRRLFKAATRCRVRTPVAGRRVPEGEPRAKMTLRENSAQRCRSCALRVESGGCATLSSGGNSIFLSFSFLSSAAIVACVGAACRIVFWFACHFSTSVIRLACGPRLDAPR